MAHTPELDRWLQYIDRQHPMAMDLGLSRLQTVLADTQWHQFDCPIITVAGTNGKGSCVESLIHLFTSMGLRIGSTTSPHLFSTSSLETDF